MRQHSLSFVTIAFVLTVICVRQSGAVVSPGSDRFSSPDFFPILPWDNINQLGQPDLDRAVGMRSIAECNFTIVGFVTPEELPACESLGLAAIVRLGSRPAMREKLRDSSDEEIDTFVKAMVDRSGGSKAVIGYYLCDEPGASLFPKLAQAVRAVKKYAPGKLAYINLFNGGASPGAKINSKLEADGFEDYLEKYVQIVKPQFISYDNYMVEYSLDMRNPKFAAAYYRDLIVVRRVALTSHLPFWNIVSCNQIRPETTIPSPANLLFQAYTTLAAGGRGVSRYHYYQGGYAYAPIDGSKHRTLTWQYLQLVNRQLRTIGPSMNHLTSTGLFLTSPPVAGSLPLLPGRLIQAVKANVPMMVGEFTSDDQVDHVMLVNLSLEESAHCLLQTTAKRKDVQIISAEDGSSLTYNQEAGLWLVAGQGVLISLH
jgi:hypothetical protein